MPRYSKTRRWRLETDGLIATGTGLSTRYLSWPVHKTRSQHTPNIDRTKCLEFFEWHSRHRQASNNEDMMLLRRGMVFATFTGSDARRISLHDCSSCYGFHYNIFVVEDPGPWR